MRGHKAHDGLTQVVYDRAPVVLLFGQSEAGLRRARLAAQVSGRRVGGEALVDAAQERLDRQIWTDGVIVIAETPSPALDALLVRVHDDAEAGRTHAVIGAPDAMIDAVTWLPFTASVEHVFGESDAALAEAVARVAAVRTPSRLHDNGRAPSLDVLQELTEDAARLASRLATLSVSGGDATEGGADAGESGALDAGFVRAMIRARRLRDQFWRGELFADPAWDMLLDLYAARLEGDRVAVSSLCIAAAVPATTALRWIKALTDRGLLVRSADPQDGRRVYIELADDAAKAMSAYLHMARRVTPLVT